MRRRIGEWLLSVGTVVVLLLILLVIYDPIREDVAHRATKPSAEISSVVHRVGYQVDAFASLALETSRTHTELVVFAIAAVVLLGFMLRT
jgi:hypothetical protein